MLEHLTKTLDLTADQQTQIKPILEAGHKQMQALRDDTSLSKEDKMAKFKSVREGMNSQINGILNPDQQKKFADMQEKMRAHRHPGGPGGQGGAESAASPAAAAIRIEH